MAKKPATKRARALKTIKVKPYRARRYGIQNHYGGVWTSETFQTEDKAQAFLDKQRPFYGGLTKKHKVVPVRVTISIIR